MMLPTQLVLAALLAEPGEEKYGLQIGAAAGLPSGTAHPILARLDGRGWQESWWKDQDPHELGRRRRYYRLTAEGAKQARAAMVGARTPVGKLLSGPVNRVRTTAAAEEMPRT
jgi:DNA-binding PadR family transcriptional regulator